MTRQIFESPVKELHLPLPQDTIDALTEAGVPVPEPAEVVLLLREPTMREKYRLDRDQGAATDYVEWFAALLMRRAAPGTDERVVRELIQDMSESTMASLTHAYLTGELPDPKLLAQVVGQTLSGMSDSLLTELTSALGRS